MIEWFEKNVKITNKAYYKTCDLHKQFLVQENDLQQHHR